MGRVRPVRAGHEIQDVVFQGPKCRRFRPNSAKCLISLNVQLNIIVVMGTTAEYAFFVLALRRSSFRVRPWQECPYVLRSVAQRQFHGV